MIYVNEILDKIQELKDKKERLKALHNAAQIPASGINALLELNFRVKFDPLNLGEYSLKEGKPEKYNPDPLTPVGMGVSNLSYLQRKLYVLGEKVVTARKEELFLVMLESLHPDEASILLLAKDGTLKHRYPWLTEKFYKDFLEFDK